MKYIKTKYFSYDYIIVVDLDFGQISINGIINSFGWLKEDNKIKELILKIIDYTKSDNLNVYYDFYEHIESSNYNAFCLYCNSV